MKIIHSILSHLAIAVLLFLNAENAARADTHADSAFLFAERSNWNEALLHSKNSNEQGLHDLILWLAILDSESSIPSSTIYAFLKKHPEWPELRKIQLRYEQALLAENADTTDALAWFKMHPPISGAGKLIQSQALLAANKDSAEAKQLLREAWVDGDFSPDIELVFATRYRNVLDAKTHEARADRLLNQGKYSAAKRLSSLLSLNYQHLINARIALETGDRKAPSLLAKLPTAYKNNAGVLYSRLKWRQAKKDDAGVIEILKKAPENLPNADKWWDIRERYVRRAIEEKKYTLAASLLKHHGLKDGPDFAEASWLKGWILLEFLNNPNDAYVEFNALYNGVNFAVSKARAAYWAGRAAAQMDQKDVAESWYKTAAFFPTTFYGQLAHSKLHGNTLITLPKSPQRNDADYAAFKTTSIAQTLKLCMKYERLDLAGRLIRALMDNAETQQEMHHIALLAKEYHSTALGVKASKRALQYNVLLLDTAYPTLDNTPNAPEPALIHAIVRQESEFDRAAKSPAGAIGYMQLLPSTAREIARKLGLNVNTINLTHRTTNIQLGSAYLSRLIQKFDGSYVLAIASYNAGQGRVGEWIQQMGKPRGNVDDIVNWIEKIPYRETRTYVQRVLENVQVYRLVLVGAKGSALKLEQDLTR